MDSRSPDAAIAAGVAHKINVEKAIIPTDAANRRARTRSNV
jgi:hypothetical protein